MVKRQRLLLAFMAKVIWGMVVLPIHSYQKAHINRHPCLLYHLMQVKVSEEVILLAWEDTVATGSKSFFIFAAAEADVFFALYL